jgi:single-stranded-DNA-specific exonuclease
MTIKTENIDSLREALNKHADENIPDEELVPLLKIDAIVSPQTMQPALLKELDMFEPFGAGNPKPVFLTKGLYITDEPLVMKDKHLKLRLADGDGRRFEAVWWDGLRKSSGRTLKPRTCIELAYTPEANVWQGTTRLQLVVEDLREDNYRSERSKQ